MAYRYISIVMYNNIMVLRPYKMKDRPGRMRSGRLIQEPVLNPKDKRPVALIKPKVSSGSVCLTAEIKNHWTHLIFKTDPDEYDPVDLSKSRC